MAKRTTTTEPTPDPEPAGPKLVVWIGPRFKTPPLTSAARHEAGTLLGMLQAGVSLGLPHSRPMPTVGPRCHELRVRDENRNWRAIYRIDADRIVVASLFAKTTGKTPKSEIELAKRRLADYDALKGSGNP